MPYSKEKKHAKPAEQVDIQQQLRDHQHTIASIQENRNTVSEMRIENFYKTSIGKNVPITYRIAKERHSDRNIRTINHAEQQCTDPQLIQQIMVDHYQNTANVVTQQTATLESFLHQHAVPLLPTLDDDQRDMLVEDITCEEVKWALQQASSTSAPGPSGQTISIFWLIFMEAPTLLTAAVNQIAFWPHLTSLPELQWIKTRKIIYIPKVPEPTTPSDYRSLSMLEVLYKLPSRILSKRLNDTLDTVLGPHQYGFQKNKGIQEPLLLVTHAMQDATYR